MPYADTDFFFAMLKESDRLHESATRLYELYKGNISTSLAVILEILLISKKLNIPTKALVGYVLDIAIVEQVDHARIRIAARYIEEQNVSIFDAFHAALCGNEIISSDHIYDKLEIKRIVL